MTNITPQIEEITPANTGNIRDEKGHFVKGVSGNPLGKPKGSLSIVSAIKSKLEEIPEGERKSNLEILVDKIIQSAKRGNDQQIKNILQYVEGMPQGSGTQILNQNNNFNNWQPKTPEDWENVKQGWLSVGREHPEWKEEL